MSDVRWSAWGLRVEHHANGYAEMTLYPGQCVIEPIPDDDVELVIMAPAYLSDGEVIDRLDAAADAWRREQPRHLSPAPDPEDAA